MKQYGIFDKIKYRVVKERGYDSYLSTRTYEKQSFISADNFKEGELRRREHNIVLYHTLMVVKQMDSQHYRAIFYNRH